jgi:two-component system, chemotaxis family, chemotaxis protein CheY
MWNILLVEDELVNQKLMVEVLKEKAVCEVASDGQEALNAYRRSVKENKPYDVILLDLLVPKTAHGMEVLEKIRKDEAARGVAKGDQVPVIVVTSYKFTSKNAFEHGCDDFIQKPIHADLLIEKISKVVKPKQASAGSN